MATHHRRHGLTQEETQAFTAILMQAQREPHDYHIQRDIGEALKRIADGTYGICPGTGRPINKRRLMAIPWAKYSIEYARLVEQGLDHSEEGFDFLENEDELPDGPDAHAA